MPALRVAFHSAVGRRDSEPQIRPTCCEGSWANMYYMISMVPSWRQRVPDVPVQMVLVK
jgi:hypothetical protein